MTAKTAPKITLWEFFQQLGKTFMLPVALLSFCGIMLGIGSSLSSHDVLTLLPWLDMPLLQAIFIWMSKVGSFAFSFLPVMFCIAIPLGLARENKGVAAFAGFVGYAVMNLAVNFWLTAKGILPTTDAAILKANNIQNIIGIPSIDTGILGAVIAGIIVWLLHERFHNIRLPDALAFFGGTRFVPIISSIVYLVVGIAMFYIWPVVQSGIAALGALVLASGYAGTFIYGLLERALIPFGLHHVFYMPFWQTAVGGTAIIDGVTVTGAQNIFFAELASKSTTVFSVSATRFMAGKFPFMMFGLPGAALAMYHCAKPEKKKAAGGLLLSAALTAFLTGITEPLEFTFIFVALPMYAVHCVLAGLSFMLMHILNVGVGMTFSGGLIDMVLFGVMQGNAKTHWIWIVVVGVVYFVIYYLVFRFMITKFNYKTPGREDDGQEVKKLDKKMSDEMMATIIEGLGGADNIQHVDACFTRLRVKVKDKALVMPDTDWKQKTGANGVVQVADGVQIIYGAKADIYKNNLKSALNMD